jgi:hypothetical protein
LLTVWAARDEAAEAFSAPRTRVIGTCTFPEAGTADGTACVTRGAITGAMTTLTGATAVVTSDSSGAMLAVTGASACVMGASTCVTGAST